MTMPTHYDGYQRFKGWDVEPFMAPTPAERAYYAAELAGVPLDGAHVLELGFGNGNFLGWARTRGAILHAAEIQEVACDKARAEGVAIVPFDLAGVAETLGGQVALIAAFDVMEHMTPERNIAMLRAACDLLRPGGLLICRFPNGQSPFGLVHQHGDLTHVTMLSIPIVEQMILDLPLRVRRAGEPATVYHEGLLRGIAKRAQLLVRRVATRAIHLVYGGYLPLYPNVVMVLERV